MKKILLSLLLMPGFLFAMKQDMVSISDKINGCKEGKSEDCRFMNRYIDKYFLALCGGQQYLKVGYSKEKNHTVPVFTFYANRQEETCMSIAYALTDMNFVEKIQKQSKLIRK